MPLGSVGGLGQRAEGLELGRVAEVPDVRRLERVVLVPAGEVDVADGPAGPAADVLDAGEQRLVDVVDLGGGGGDGLDQRDERGVGGELAVRRGSGGGGGGVDARRGRACARGPQRPPLRPWRRAPTSAAIWARVGFFEGPGILTRSSDAVRRLECRFCQDSVVRGSCGTRPAARRGPGAARARAWPRRRRVVVRTCSTYSAHGVAQLQVLGAARTPRGASAPSR